MISLLGLLIVAALAPVVSNLRIKTVKRTYLALPDLRSKVIMGHLGLLVMLLGAPQRARRGRWSWFDATLAAWVLGTAASAWRSERPLRSILPRPGRGDGLITTAMYAMTIWTASRLDGQEEQIAVWATVGAAQFASVLAMRQVVLRTLEHRRTGASQSMAESVFVNPTFFAGYLSLVTPTVVSALPKPLAVPLLTGLALSGIRSAWMGVAAILPWSLLSGRQRLGPLVAAASVPALAAWAVAPANWKKRIFAVDSLTERAYLCGWATSRWWRRPLLGWGPNTFGKPTEDASNFHDAAHNELAEQLGNTGLAGTLPYLALWAFAIRRGLRSAPSLVQGLTSYAVWLLTHWTHLGPANAWALWMGLAAKEGSYVTTTTTRTTHHSRHHRQRGPTHPRWQNRHDRVRPRSASPAAFGAPRYDAP